MNIGKRYRLDTDSYNIILQEKKHAKETEKNSAHDYWRNIAYFSTAKSALQYWVELEVKGTHLKDLKTVVAKIDEVYKLIGSLKDSQMPTTSRTTCIEG